MAQHKSGFSKKIKNVEDETGKKHIKIQKNSSKNAITLYRYFDNIIPYIKETSNIYTEYLLKNGVIVSKTLISTESSGQETVEFEIYSGNKMFVDSEGMKKECSLKITNLPKYTRMKFEIEINISTAGLMNVLNSKSSVISYSSRLLYIE